MNDELHFSHADSSWFSASFPAKGWPEFVPIADIQNPQKGFVVGDQCVIEVEISLQAVASNAA